jgi:type I restriction enzyme, S subunit
LKAYSSYKDSKLKWIGDIPNHWDIGKLNHITNKLTNGFVGSTRGIMKEIGVRYLQGIHIKNGEIVFTPDGPYYVSEEWSDNHAKSILKEGDVLVVQTGTIGEVGYVNSNFENCNCHALIIIQIKGEYGIGKFLRYFIMSNYVKNYFRTIKTGEILEHLNTKRVKYLKMCLPNIYEQKQIVLFLDSKTQKLDKLIELTEQKIELLKEQRTALINQCVTKGLNPNVEMKDSGVEWIGEIPKHWNLIALKLLVSTKIMDGPHTTPQFVDVGIPFLSVESVQDNKLDFQRKRGFITKEAHEEYSKKCKPQKGDIFLVKSGSTTGKSAMVETDDDFNIWSPICIIRSNQAKVLPRFTFASIQSFYFRRFVELGWSFGTQPNIGMGVVENIRIIIPPLNEQTQIIHQIEGKAQKIDSTIEKESKRIELLKEYRQSLISEVVTGKIDVRDFNAI